MPTLMCPDVLVDGTGGEARRNACVVIEDERIAFVGSRHELDAAYPDRSDWDELDGAGSSLIPGMIDGHAHLTLENLEYGSDPRSSPPQEAIVLYTLQAARETELGVGDHAKREPDHAREAPEAAERGRDSGHEVPWEYGRGSDPRQDTGRDRDGNLPEPGAERHQGGRDSGRSGHWRGRSHEPEREAAAEKSMEPAQKSVDLDLGM